MMNEELNMTNLPTYLPNRTDIRISAEGDYYDGKFTIEVESYWNMSEKSWAMPAWEEMGYPDLHHHFDSVEEALAALRADYLID
jgi:hypothetical protein